MCPRLSYRTNLNRSKGSLQVPGTETPTFNSLNLPSENTFSVSPDIEENKAIDIK